MASREAGESALFERAVASGRLTTPPVDSLTPMRIWTARIGVELLKEKGMKMGGVGEV